MFLCKMEGKGDFEVLNFFVVVSGRVALSFFSSLF